MTHPYEETLTTAVAEAPEGQPLPTESTAASSRAHAPLLTALFASTALAACGGGGGGDSTPGTGAPGAPGTPAPTTPSLGNYTHPSATSDNEAARFLLQAQFSASTAEIAALRATAYADWLESQFNAGPSQGR